MKKRESILSLLPSFVVSELKEQSKSIHQALAAIPSDAAEQLRARDREIRVLTRHCESWHEKAKSATQKLAAANKALSALERELNKLRALHEALSGSLRRRRDDTTVFHDSSILRKKDLKPRS